MVITGAKKDAPLGEGIIKLCKNKPISLCGKTTLKQLAMVLKKAKVVIANDSGPMHIAVSQRAPTIAIFGPTSPKITGPYGDSKYAVLHKWDECQVPCYKRCSNYRCIEAITVDDVLMAVKKIYEDR